MALDFDPKTNTLNDLPLTAENLLTLGLDQVLADMAGAHPAWGDEFAAMLDGTEDDLGRATKLVAFLEEKSRVFAARGNKKMRDRKGPPPGAH